MKRNSRISTRQEKLIAALLSERTIDAACKSVNVAVTTYWRWMKDVNFLLEYRAARRGIMENAIAKIQSITFDAIDTLERNLNCENASVEIRCAAIILEQSIKGVELLDVADRLDALESLIKHREEQDAQVRKPN